MAFKGFGLICLSVAIGDDDKQFLYRVVEHTKMGETSEYDRTLSKFRQYIGRNSKDKTVNMGGDRFFVHKGGTWDAVSQEEYNRQLELWRKA